MKRLIILFCCLLIIGCKSVSITNSDELKLNFLDEFVLPADLTFEGNLVGGLSGIDYHNGEYFLVCDDASNPRYYEANIDINKRKILSVDVQKAVRIKDTAHYLDLESIRFDVNTNQVFLTSEGHIKGNKNPMFFSVNSDGNVENIFKIPSEFYANSKQKPRHNGTLEGLSNSFDGKGYWIAMELPLEADGPEPKITPTKSPVRITYIDASSKKSEKQFAYNLDLITKPPKGSFAVNGLTEILEYKEDKFLVIERSYSSGLGNQSNTIKIFKITASKASNTLAVNSLLNSNYRPATKELLFDFESVRNQLTDKTIDNIEGISFGPILSNGNKSLLLIADNNFNKLGKQLNQLILMEIID
jgi:hypothetical protein